MKCKIHLQTFLLDVRFMYFTIFLLVENEVEVNLTVVENSTVALPFIIPPKTENISESRRLEWYKTIPWYKTKHSGKNRIALFMGDIKRTKWWGEFRRDSNKASLDNVTGILTFHHVQLHDTDRYFYRINPREPHYRPRT